MKLFKDKDFVTILVSNITAIAICVILNLIDHERLFGLSVLAICIGLLPSFFIALRDINNRIKEK